MFGIDEIYYEKRKIVHNNIKGNNNRYVQDVIQQYLIHTP